MSDITKRALEKSLKNMMLKKPVNKITINDIAEDCGVNRATFYYHFKDIYDLIEWSCEEDSRKAADGNTTYDTWEQIIQYLYRVVYGLIINVVEECAQGMDVREDDKRFIADFYKYAFVGMMLDWIRQDMKPSPEKMIFRLSSLIEGDIIRMLEKCRIDKPHYKTDKSHI